jgi:opacity protein-like surface antigen
MVFKAPIRSAWTWAGFYVGGTIGYGWGKSNTDAVFSDPATAGQLFATNGSRKLEGAIGGAQGGYNWVAGNMLAGVEADLNYSGQRARMRAAARARSAIPLSSASASDPSVLALSDQGQKLEWFATLRGRLGATVTPGALAYVTGGLAVGEIMTAGTVFGFDGDGNPSTPSISSHNTKAGGRSAAASRAACRQLDRQARIPLSRSRHGLDRADPRGECDGRDRLQFPRHRQHRARGPQLQVRYPCGHLGQRLIGRSPRHAAARKYSRAPPDVIRAGTPPWPRRPRRETPRARRAFPRGSVMLRMPGMAASASISPRVTAARVSAP